MSGIAVVVGATLLALSVWSSGPAKAVGAERQPALLRASTAAGPSRARSGGPQAQPEGLLPAPYDAEQFDTQLVSAQSVPSDPRTFELAGFKVGMSAREAERSAKRLHLHYNSGAAYARSFDDRAAQVAAAKLHEPATETKRVLQHTNLRGADGSRYSLTFLPTEAGATLAQLLYFTPWAGNTPRAFLDALKARYGATKDASASADTLSAKWCSKADPTCDGKPSLTATSTPEGVDLQLWVGKAASVALDKRIETRGFAVASERAKKPSF